MVRTPDKTDWRLITRAERDGDLVRPLFSVQDPQGKEEGSAEGEAVPLQAWANADPPLLDTRSPPRPRHGSVRS